MERNMCRVSMYRCSLNNTVFVLFFSPVIFFLSLSLSLFVCDVGDGTRDVEKLTGLFSRRMSSDGNPDFLPRKLSSLHLQPLLRNSKRIRRTQLKSDSNSDGNPDFLPRKLSSCHLHRRSSSSKSSPSFMMSDIMMSLE